MVEVDLSILEIGGGGELIRAIAESLQLENSEGKIGQSSMTTSLHYIGQPLHLLHWIENAQALGRYILIAAHGNEAGIHFGQDYAEDIDCSTLVGGYFPYELLFKKGQFQNKTVFNSACASATPFARKSFRPQQGFSYVGYNGYPDGDADILIYHKLLYELAKGQSLANALLAARAVCPDGSLLARFD